MSDLTVEQQAKLLALTDLKGIGDKRAQKLVSVARGVDSVYETPFSTLSDLHYVSEQTFAQLQDLDSEISQYESQIRQAAEDGVSLATPYDSLYPEQLQTQHAPLKLFTKGDESLLTSSMVSFAGSRDANDSAIEWTSRIAGGLADEGYTIVSGGAFGIDAAAHRAALDKRGPTIIVSPSGHNVPYPKAHEELFKRVINEGLVVSHRFPNQDPARGGFLYRNRTNSALSEAIIIAAASDDGGSMSQFETAVKQGKTVFVPDESVGSLPDSGLAEMRASDDTVVVESLGDVLDEINVNDGQSSLNDW
ncbi:DNA-processing protein DprA [Haloferax larsenii]|uniref:DNA processing protein n=1 Tax=Haloferax larsenii TaxID=302484 RepID=A0A1H7UAF0_HALLR|nr:DNA-processing protein DprA [Haloferax larsenii]SEL93678.1 DNA processing protein [Haloferax larsenii]